MLANDTGGEIPPRSVSEDGVEPYAHPLEWTDWIELAS
jgi:hypothetical protein